MKKIIILIFWMVILSGFVSAELYDDLMDQFWGFDEGTGLTTTDAVNQHSVTITGNPDWRTASEDCMVAPCLQFNQSEGTKDYLDIGTEHIPTGSDEVCFTGWVKLKTDTGNCFANWGTSATNNMVGIFYYDVEDKWFVDNYAHYDWARTNAPPIDLEKWYMYTYTYNGTGQTAWINTTIVGNETYITLDVKTTFYYIAKRQDSYALDGILDLIRVYNKSCNQTMVDFLYNNGSGRNYTPLDITPPEVCNNLDDDFDGLIDENLTQSCYTGPAGTEGVGVCKAGTETCTAGVWSSCEGEILPSAEVCDGLDNDCNGLIDDSIANIITDVYGYDDIGECKVQIESCVNGAWQITQAAIGPSTEICDNLDNDCDGLTDEDLTQICGVTDVGVCTFGIETCSAGSWVDCTAIFPTTEVCDGLDNNCDGQIDETICGEPTDADCDGVNDCTSDKCPGTVLPESIPTKTLLPNHYADVDGDKIFETLLGYGDDDYTLTDTHGCSCEQIVECKPGENKGEYKHGCTKGTMNIWIKQRGWAKTCSYKDDDD